MKAARHHKVLGLAVTERSILVAEVNTAGGDAAARPDARRLAEFPFPAGVSVNDPAVLGAALGGFLKEHKFGAKNAVVGLPAKWLLVKSKEVPPADDATIADMLRLQAEGEFSSELKDLTYDYTGKPTKTNNGTQCVLLVATPRKYVEMAEQLCEAAKLNPIAITSSAAALGAVTGRTVAKNAVVLTLANGGAELTAQSGETPNTLRHLRSPTPEALFLSDLRRAVSTIPPNGSARELIVWDGGIGDGGNATAHRLGDSLGMRVRAGDLPSLGVSTTEAASNGGGRIYAPAVALALSALAPQQAPVVDFLHSRLAPPVQKRVAPWMIWTAVGVLVAVLLGVWGYVKLQGAEAELEQKKTENKLAQPKAETARKFVETVGFAEKWHGSENPRYIACLSDITVLVPNDYATYSTSMTIREKDDKKPDVVASKSTGPAPLPTAATKPSERPLIVTFYGRAPNQDRALDMFRRVQAATATAGTKGRFTEVKLNGTNVVNVGGGSRATEVAFSFQCTYVPPDPFAPAAPAASNANAKGGANAGKSGTR